MHPLGIDTSVSTPILRIQRAYANSSFRWRIPFKALWDVHKLQRLTMSYSQRPHLLFCFCRRVTTIGNILSQSVIHFSVAAKYKANTPNECIPKSKITIVKHQFMFVTWGKKTDEIFHFRELNNKTMLRTMIKIFHCFGFFVFHFHFFSDAKTETEKLYYEWDSVRVCGCMQTGGWVVMALRILCSLISGEWSYGKWKESRRKNKI